MSTLLAEAGVLVYQFFSVRKLSVRLFDIRNAVKVVLISMLASAGLVALHMAGLQPLETVLLGSLIYFGIVYGVLVIWGDPVLKLAIQRLRKLKG
jgi:hypothetical protein